MLESLLPLELRPSAIIETFADGSFQEAEAGFEALLLPVRDADDAIIDIVAWKIGHDRPWWRYKRIGDVLGYQALAACRWPHTGFPELVLYETPRRWLAAVSPAAVCILDWSADLETMFAGVDAKLVCETRELYDHFHQSLINQRSPGLAAAVGVL